MNCEQKSGVFLNLSCDRTITNTCSNCAKQVCQVHFHHYEASDLCEDCYWEKYMYAEQAQEYVDTYIDTTDSSSSTSSYSPATSSDEGFNDGFGGGGFGGGGASGEWTAGEANGFNETDANGGILDNDDTFYYS